MFPSPTIKLSIITVSLNNALGLRKTIESVITQTNKEFEYIIIDGGSYDGSLEIIKSYTTISQGVYTPMSFTCPITFWLSEPDFGIYNAMNKGIAAAKGEYCQFLNSGDWLIYSDVTSRMLKRLPDSSIVYGNMFKQLSVKTTIINKEVPANSLLTFYTGSLNHSSAYIKRSLFEKYGLYDENLKIVSDWKFFLITIVLNNESVSYQNIDLTCTDTCGISNTNNNLHILERGKVLEQLIPANILSDYDQFSKLILQMKRINNYKFTRWFVWFIERILFKLEKQLSRMKSNSDYNKIHSR